MITANLFSLKCSNIHWRSMQSTHSITHISQDTVSFAHINDTMWLYWNKPNLQSTSGTTEGVFLQHSCILMLIVWKRLNHYNLTYLYKMVKYIFVLTSCLHTVVKNSHFPLRAIWICWYWNIKKFVIPVVLW